MWVTLTRIIYTILTATLLFLLYDYRKDDAKKRRDKEFSARHQTSPHPATQRDTRAPLANTVRCQSMSTLNLSTLERYGCEFPQHNMSSRDFLGYGSFDTSPSQKDVWKNALEKFGCGSCGPRSFYGTMDAHRMTEEKFKEWWGAEDALLYSGWRQLILSLPCAFASGREHTFIYDEAVRPPIMEGMSLARCISVPFRHNDMVHLEETLKTLPKASPVARRFLYVEGVYLNRGTVCELRRVADLALQYGCRLIVDDTMGFGVIGETTGTLGHTGVKLSEVSMLVIGLDAALGSVGAICIGTKETIKPQHTASPGYLFSASSPPFHLECVRSSLDMMKSEEGLERQLRLQRFSATFLDTFHSSGRRQCSSVPIYHIYVASRCNGVATIYSPTLDIDEALVTLEEHERYVIEGMLETVSIMLEKQMNVRVPRVIHSEKHAPLHPPCLRVCLTLASCPMNGEDVWLKEIIEFIGLALNGINN